MEEVTVDKDIMVDQYIPIWQSTESARNKLRRQYFPDRLSVLFIGEAPPASGRFFYRKDSGLYRAFRGAFQLVDPTINDENFLRVFRASGCYLIDLCGRPVDQLTLAARRAACIAGEPELSRKLKTLRPETIVPVVHSIRDNVNRAVVGTGWIGERLDLPYPGRWKRHREIFISQLVPLIRCVTNVPDRRAG
jgi:hypothetical protein